MMSTLVEGTAYWSAHTVEPVAAVAGAAAQDGRHSEGVLGCVLLVLATPDRLPPPGEPAGRLDMGSCGDGMMTG